MMVRLFLSLRRTDLSVVGNFFTRDVVMQLINCLQPDDLRMSGCTSPQPDRCTLSHIDTHTLTHPAHNVSPHLITVFNLLHTIYSFLQSHHTCTHTQNKTLVCVLMTNQFLCEFPGGAVRLQPPSSVSCDRGMKAEP